MRSYDDDVEMFCIESYDDEMMFGVEIFDDEMTFEHSGICDSVVH